MPTVEKTRGNRVYIRGVGRFGRGDRANVDEDTAAYLCDERGDFERVGDANDGEDEADGGGGDVGDDANGDPYLDLPTDYDEMTKTELYDIATELDIDGRSTMDKDELIEAIQAGV